MVARRAAVLALHSGAHPAMLWATVGYSYELAASLGVDLPNRRWPGSGSGHIRPRSDLLDEDRMCQFLGQLEPVMTG